MSEVKVTKDLENKTLTLEREFNGPKDKVWKAYADKEWFESWWGPEGWETTAKEFDFRAGGRVLYAMKCVDENQGDWYGKTEWGLMEIGTLDEPDSFTYDDLFADENGTVKEDMPKLKITVSLAEADGKTLLTIHSLADSAEQIEQLVKMGMVEGFSSQMNKLDQLLAR